MTTPFRIEPDQVRRYNGISYELSILGGRVRHCMLVRPRRLIGVANIGRLNGQLGRAEQND